MFKKLAPLFLLFLFTFSSIAQKKKDVLLTIDETPVHTSEFVRVYKKNLELVQDDSQKDVENYLELFIDYKLKIAEAYRQKLHEDSNYKKEFSKYQEQLSRNYLYEDKVNDDLAMEAYQRGLEEINASHILVFTSFDDLPQDTLTAYNKIEKIRERALKGEDFEKLARETSEEPSAKERGGNLGYFSVFTLVYPFETAAYNTPVGEISEIVRTQFGYHIIKVIDRRKKLHELTVSHIMLSDKADSTRTFDPEERIKELHSLIQQGESFENLAKQFSDDKSSGKRGGQLNKFSKGDLRSDEFEEAAYALETAGDVSEPVKTSFGWHLIRLDEIHTIPTFEEKKRDLLNRVQDASRTKIVTNKVNKKIKDKYGYTNDGTYKTFFNEYLKDEVLQRKWVYDTLSGEQDKVIFTIGDRELHYSDFAEYINDRQRRTKAYKTKEGLINGMFDEFETLELKNYFRDRLEFENEEYAGIITEYRDGLLIFDVMDKNIWGKAKNDSIGLQKFYDATKEQYVWKKRVDAIIVSATNNATAREVGKLLEQSKTEEDIKKQFNTEEAVNVIISNGVFEIDQSDLPENFEVVKGVSKIYPVDDSFVIVKVKEIIEPSIKTLDEVKGKVLSNYQNHLEENWVKELRKKYEVEINKKALRKVIKELSS